jgi:UPF0716 protein FxsA
VGHWQLHDSSAAFEAEVRIRARRDVDANFGFAALGRAASLVKRIAIALLLLPAAELVVFLLVVWAIGFLPALGLMILTSFAGGLVLRHAGRGGITQVGAHVRVAVRDRGATQGAIESGGLVFAISGILLLLPGFITDLLGAGLLVRPIRSRLAAAIGRAVGIRKATTGPGSVLDLAPDEWQSVPDQHLPKPDNR